MRGDKGYDGSFIGDTDIRRDANKAMGLVPDVLPTDAGVAFGIKESELFTPFGAGVIFISEKEVPKDAKTDTDTRPITEIE
jgi:hypothetical protein